MNKANTRTTELEGGIPLGDNPGVTDSLDLSEAVTDPTQMKSIHEGNEPVEFTTDPDRQLYGLIDPNGALVPHSLTYDADHWIWWMQCAGGWYQLQRKPIPDLPELFKLGWQVCPLDIKPEQAIPITAFSNPAEPQCPEFPEDEEDGATNDANVAQHQGNRNPAHTPPAAPYATPLSPTERRGSSGARESDSQ